MTDNEGQARVGLIARLEQIEQFIKDSQAFNKAVEAMQGSARSAAAQIDSAFTRAVGNIRAAIGELSRSGAGLDAMERRIRSWNALMGRSDPSRPVSGATGDYYADSFARAQEERQHEEELKRYDDWAKAQEKAYRDARRRAKAYAQWQATGFGAPPPGATVPGTGAPPGAAPGGAPGGWPGVNMAGGAPPFMPGMPGGLDWGRNTGGGFWERFQKEAVRMGALRGGMFWRFARAAGGPMMGVAAGVYVAQQAIQGLIKTWNSLNEAVESTDQQLRAGMAWEQMAKAADLSAGQIVDSAVKMSRHTVKEYDVIMEGNRLLLSDYDHIAKAIPDLMERAYAWAPKLGKGTEDVFGDLISAIEKGDAEAFRQYGLFEDVNSALEEYSEKWRVAIDDMSDAEKQLVSLNAVLEGVPPTLTDVTASAQSMDEQWTQFRDTWQSLWQMVKARAGRSIMEDLGSLFHGDEDFLSNTIMVAEQLEKIAQRRDLVLAGIRETMPGIDLSDITDELYRVESDFLDLYNQMKGKDWDAVFEGLEDAAETVDEAWQKANVELMVQEINRLLQTIADSHDDTSEAEKNAWAIAEALYAIVGAARELDPSAVLALVEGLAGLRGIAGEAGLPGFEEETAVAREIRRQKELKGLRESLLDDAEQWGLQLADVADSATVLKLVDQYQQDIMNNVDEGIMKLPEFQRKLYIRQNITKSWDELLDKMEEAGKPPSLSDLREYNKYLLLTGGGAPWAVGFAQEHGGRTPVEQYKKHADPMVAAVIDKLWGEDFERREGRPPTEQEWRGHWYEQWAPLELWPGGPIAGATGPEAERAKEWIKLMGYTEDLGEAEHEAYLKTQKLIPELEGFKTQQEVLNEYMSEHTVPSLGSFTTELGTTTNAIVDSGNRLKELWDKPPGLPPSGETPPGEVESPEDVLESYRGQPTAGKPGAAEMEIYVDKNGRVFRRNDPNSRIWTYVPQMQGGGLTRGGGLFMLHPNELVLPMSKLMDMTSMRMNSLLGGGGGVNIGSLNVPVNIGDGTSVSAAEVQQAVVNAIRGRAGTALMRQARRLGVV